MSPAQESDNESLCRQPCPLCVGPCDARVPCQRIFARNLYDGGGARSVPDMDVTAALGGVDNIVDTKPESALAERLRRFREQSGMTRSQLAERAGLSRPTIWAWECGKTRPRQNNLRTLALALGISEQELIGKDCSEPVYNEYDPLGPVVWSEDRISTRLPNADRLRIMMYAAKLGIAALAGVKARNVKISIEI